MNERLRCALIGQDTVYEELKDKHFDFLVSLYELAFSTYEGFKFKKFITNKK